MSKILFLFNSSDDVLHLRNYLINKFPEEHFDVYYVLDREKIPYWKEKLSNIHFIPFDYNHSGRTSLSLLCNLKIFWRFYLLLKKQNPDILFLGNIKPLVYGGILGHFLKIKNIYGLVSGLGYAFTDDKKPKRIFVHWLCLKLYKISLPKFRCVFFQNTDDRNFFVKKNIVASKNTRVVNGTGVDLKIFTPKPFPQTLTFFMAARLLKEKGIFEYVEAAKSLKEKYPQVRFLLAGNLDTNPSSITPKQLQYCKMYVQYEGFCHDMAKTLNHCSVFVYPSYYREGIPRALLEALACGRAIITTDNVGCRETVIDNENGFKIKPKSVSSLVEAMEKFIQDPRILVPMGEKSRRLAEKRFDIHAVNSEIYNTVIHTIR